MKKLISALCAVSLLTGSLNCLTGNAVTYFPFTLETESFYYTGGKFSEITPAPQTNTGNCANFLITGTFRYDGPQETVTGKPTICYTVIYFDTFHEEKNGQITLSSTQGYGTLSAVMLGLYVENADTFNVGDFLYINNVAIEENYPANYYPDKYDDTVVEYAGNGLDIFGNDFMKVMRHELIANPLRAGMTADSTTSDLSKLEIVKGDANEDETINIVDVISVNKNIMGKETLNDYSILATDINKDGVPDSEDALSILKYVVGLVTSFTE